MTNKQHVPGQGKAMKTFPPNVTTTMVSFLQCNIKYIGGKAYLLQEISDTYNDYRGNFGVKYNLQFPNTLTAAFTKHGNIITHKRINGSKHQVITTTNPTKIQPITINVMMKAKKRGKVERSYFLTIVHMKDCLKLHRWLVITRFIY